MVRFNARCMPLPCPRTKAPLADLLRSDAPVWVKREQRLQQLAEQVVLRQDGRLQRPVQRHQKRLRVCHVPHGSNTFGSFFDPLCTVPVVPWVVVRLNIMWAAKTLTSSSQFPLSV